MITYLICWLLGHKFVHKVHSGKTKKYFLGDSYDANVWRWEQLPFCIRCGKPNVNYEYQK